MTIVEIVEPSEAQRQLALYNRASDMVKRADYTPPAGTAWAVVGLVLVDAATPANETTLINAMTALAEITAVANPRIWGELPSAILINPEGGDPTHECKLCVESLLSARVGYGGDRQSLQQRKYEEVSPPLGKKWIVCNVVLAAPIAQAADIVALEAALTGIAGVTVAEHLIDGVVPENATGAKLSITTRMRIDPIPVEEP